MSLVSVMSERLKRLKESVELNAAGRDVTIIAKDRVVQARLVKVFSRIITADAVNERGARTLGRLLS